MDEKPAEEMDGTGNNVEKMDKYLTRGGGVSVIVLMGLMYQSIQGLQQEVSATNQTLIRVTAELDITSPRDIKDELVRVTADMVTSEDVERIVLANAPWNQDRDEIEKRLLELEIRLKINNEP